MAHTNSTSNYELSQFIGTDKPTFLGDYNGDMQKIDAAIKGAKDTADGASTTANAASALATSASETATQAATDAASASANATTALNTANGATTTANNASTTATAAETAATAASTKADAAKAEAEAATAAVALKPSYSETFARMFNMTSAALTPVAASPFTVALAEVYGAKNTDASLAKIYGRVVITGTVAQATSGKMATLATGYGTRAQDFTIYGFSGKASTGSGDIDGINIWLVVKANGDIELHGNYDVGYTALTVYFPPCLLVMSDFGDNSTR